MIVAQYLISSNNNNKIENSIKITPRIFYFKAR